LKIFFENILSFFSNCFILSKQKQKFQYSSNELLKAQIIAIPYIGRQLDMFIILPNVGDKESIKNLLNDLTIETLEKFMDSMKKEECDLWLPKFKSESKLLLKDYLTQLGFETIFTPKADLSAINGKTGLHVSQVLKFQKF
jgi:serine protease inhibitor